MSQYIAMGTVGEFFCHHRLYCLNGANLELPQLITAPAAILSGRAGAALFITCSLSQLTFTISLVRRKSNELEQANEKQMWSVHKTITWGF